MAQENERPGPDVSGPHGQPIPPPGEQPGAHPPQEPGAILRPRAGDAVTQSWKTAWGLFRSDPVVLPVAGLSAAVLGTVTLGILMGPLIWGVLALCFERLRVNRPMDLKETFNHFERLGTSFGIVFLSWFAIAVGFVLLVIPGLYMAVVLLYALPIGFEEKLGAVDAMKESRRRVHASGFWAHALLAATFFGVSWLMSAIFEALGGVLTLAITLPVLAAAYEHYIRPHRISVAH